ncbi:NAD(P)/FAD-dependent oxidoreductase [Paractinoplanes hotanensis]|uniref:FAD-dependent oxidoreductase n=1 Tax=Paractinoplanes hotanensis TaxID=2906497 RepID=A0ABT0XVI0_9ACTN|nr:FAD-dependent oxidoreductase [Actinoplanes hotanensis]MCM4077759.1 FAD-dependent oxidoreductase [Actinoplanes hotanensis]
MTVVVVGAGIAGLACARELGDAGVPARVLERSGEPGGRLASVFLDGRFADVGAAHVTADDASFQGRLQSWRIEGLARPWTDTFRGQQGPGPMRWSAPAGLRSLAHSLAAGVDITYGTEVTELPEAEYVVLAMPGPEALRIADLPAARDQSWDPVLTAVLTYPRRSWDDFGGMFVNDHPAVATICDDGDRRGDRAPVLVAHSTPQFARDEASRLSRDETSRLAQGGIARGERPQVGRGGARDAMVTAVNGVLGIEEAPETAYRLWPYAQPRPLPGDFARSGNVYLCGDVFGRPRVQTAWLSGRAVAEDILRARSGRPPSSPRRSATS